MRFYIEVDLLMKRFLTSFEMTISELSEDIGEGLRRSRKPSPISSLSL